VLPLHRHAHPRAHRTPNPASNESKGIKQLSLYPENRGCPAPTAARILDIFTSLARRHLLDHHGRLVQSFAPQLNELQQLVLDLLGIPHRIYTG
jgi:hypothetical protein